MLIAERTFVIDATRERIWELLLRATLRLMPFERCNIRSETAFSALLRMKVAFVSLPMDVDMNIVDIVPPETLNTELKAKGMGGMVWINQKSTFALKAVGESKTEVTAIIVAEGMAHILKIFFVPMVKKFAAASFKNLEELLRSFTISLNIYEISVKVLGTFRTF